MGGRIAGGRLRARTNGLGKSADTRPQQETSKGKKNNGLVWRTRNEDDNEKIKK
jgi:hypothetical protein